MAILDFNGVDAKQPQIVDEFGRPFARAENGDQVPTPNIPHILGFVSKFNTATRSYPWRWDEAYKNSSKTALSMRRDCWLQSMLKERQRPSSKMRWQIEADDMKDPAQVKACDDMTKLVKGIPHFRRLRKSLLEALWYGRFGVQVKYDWTMISGGRAFIPVEHWPVNGDKIQYDYDGVPRIFIYGGAKNWLAAQGAHIVMTDRQPAVALDTPHWRDRFIIHHHDCIDADFYEADMSGGIFGVGIRHWIYWMNWVRQEVESWVVDFMERVGLGLTIYYYEEGNNASYVQAKEAALQDGRNTVIVWPRSTEGNKVGPGIDRLEAQTSGAAFIVELMKYFDAKIERFIIGQSLSTGGGRDKGGELGGSGRAEFAADTKGDIIDDDCEDLDQTLTKDLIKPLQRFNLQSTLGFNLRFSSQIQENKPKPKLDAAKSLFDMGVELKADELRETSGFTKPREGDAIVKQQSPMLGMGPDGKPFGDKPGGQRNLPFMENKPEKNGALNGAAHE